MLHVAAGPEEQDDRADHRRGREHRVLERAEREHARDGLAASKPRAAERPVVDREAAGSVGGGEDAEPGDHGAHRQPEREERPAVDAADVAHREDVPEVGEHLAAETDGEPGRDDVLHGVDEPAVARHVGEPHRRRERERAGDEQDQQVAPLELERGDARLRLSLLERSRLAVHRSRASIGSSSRIGNPDSTVLFPSTCVDHIDTLVPAVGAGDTEEEREPAPEAEAALLDERAREDELAVPADEVLSLLLADAVDVDLDRSLGARAAVQRATRPPP